MPKYAKDLAILLVPVAIVAILFPFLPKQIPLQWRFDGSTRYGDKAQLFLVALLPFVVYKFRRQKTGR